MSKVQAAIVGIGESRVGSVPDRSALQLQADAAQAAVLRRQDAEVERTRLEGLKSLGVDLTAYLTRKQADRVVEVKGGPVHVETR